jgi:hypothetical protein
VLKVVFTAKDKYLMEQYKEQYEAEMKEARGWIKNGKVLGVNEYPIYMDLSIDALDEFFKQEASRDGMVAKEMLEHEIGKETNAIYKDLVEDSYESRCNYACTLYEMYKDRMVKVTF